MRTTQGRQTAVTSTTQGRQTAVTSTAREAKRLAAGRAAAQIVLGATALRAAKKGPRGLGTSDLFVRNADGSYATNAVSLDRIPAKRAVRVGKQVHDSASIRQLLARDPRAPNPLTRQPFPDHVYRKYGPRTPGAGPASDAALGNVLGAARALVESRGSHGDRALAQRLEQRFGTSISIENFDEPKWFISAGTFDAVVVFRPRRYDVEIVEYDDAMMDILATQRFSFPR